MNGHPDAVPDIPPLLQFSIDTVLGDVGVEIQRQDDLARAGKFGGTHILPGGPNVDRLRVLVEEVGEVAKELNEIDIRRARGETPKKGEVRRMELGLYEELNQVGACAVAWAAALREGR